jgi:hypothetical protein
MDVDLISGLICYIDLYCMCMLHLVFFVNVECVASDGIRVVLNWVRIWRAFGCLVLLVLL